MRADKDPVKSINAVAARLSREPRQLQRPMDTAPAYSHDALALAFSKRHASELIHVPEWNEWLAWDGARWQPEPFTAIMERARLVCRSASQGASPAVAAGITSAPTIAAVEKLARGDGRHRRTAEQFDADPWALNTPAGVVDLRSGFRRQHSAEDLMMKMTAVAPGGECPRWRAFVREITCNDDDLAAYLQRWAGYMLTGITKEQAFIFAHGPGGNGKTVFFDTMFSVMGDYAAVADMGLLTVTKHEQHPVALAVLHGARLVLAQETEAGAALAEAKIKALTGGGQVTARHMRSQPVSYEPQFKLAMVGNHLPVLRHPDAAMRRRLHLVPFKYRPPHPDPELADELRSERPGVLAWMIDGAKEWHRHGGLGMPEAVRSAVNAYFADQDLVAAWIEARCSRLPTARMRSSKAYQDWRAWASAQGEDPGTQKAFSARMDPHAMRKHTNAGAVFMGLCLRADAGRPE